MCPLQRIHSWIQPCLKVVDLEEQLQNSQCSVETEREQRKIAEKELLVSNLTLLAFGFYSTRPKKSSPVKLEYQMMVNI